METMNAEREPEEERTMDSVPFPQGLPESPQCRMIALCFADPSSVRFRIEGGREFFEESRPVENVRIDRPEPMSTTWQKRHGGELTASVFDALRRHPEGTMLAIEIHDLALTTEDIAAAVGRYEEPEAA
jgi:hypothetical protein